MGNDLQSLVIVVLVTFGAERVDTEELIDLIVGEYGADRAQCGEMIERMIDDGKLVARDHFVSLSPEQWKLHLLDKVNANGVAAPGDVIDMVLSVLMPARMMEEVQA